MAAAERDYIITDRVASPLPLASQYLEKLLYMPRSFTPSAHALCLPDFARTVPGFERELEQARSAFAAKTSAWTDSVAHPTVAALPPVFQQLVLLSAVKAPRKRDVPPFGHGIADDSAFVFCNFGNWNKVNAVSMRLWLRALVS
jgi:predicted O-linked N-acetylglucosamine transferase (SPINDLY family)